MKALENTFIFLKSIYGSEEEWIIKDKTLKIPKGSGLYILWNKKFENEIEDNKKEDWYKAWYNLKKDSIERLLELKEIIEKYLKKPYNVKLVDRKEFKRAREKYFEKKYK
jgi:hypothetical protein